MGGAVAAGRTHELRLWSIYSRAGGWSGSSLVSLFVREEFPFDLHELAASVPAGGPGCFCLVIRVAVGEYQFLKQKGPRRMPQQAAPGVLMEALSVLVSQNDIAN